jgi:hypothetical protein
MRVSSRSDLKPLTLIAVMPVGGVVVSSLIMLPVSTQKDEAIPVLFSQMRNVCYCKRARAWAAGVKLGLK